MYAIKDVLGISAVLLTFVSYIPYFRSIIKGKTKPHIYSWFVWLIDSLIIFSLQITHGGGAGSFMALAAAVMCLVVLVLSFRSKGKRDIKIIDTVFLTVAFASLAIWLVVRQPVVSAMLITTVDLFGFAPTIRKSWNKPHSETAVFYGLNILRFVLALAALQEYTVVTVLYPGVWFIANVLFTLMLLIRRSQIQVRESNKLG